MLRFLLLSVLVSGFALGSAHPVAAFDYTEPVVPPQFLMNGPTVAAPPVSGGTANGGARLLAQGMGLAPAAVALPVGPSPDGAPQEARSVSVSWLRDGAPGPLQVIPNSQWTDGGGGCAVWDWTGC